MSRINKNDKQFQDSIKLGKRSNSLIPQIKKWCSNIKIESEYGGMMGQMGLPTMNTISCTQFRGDSAMNLEWIARDFIVENCPNCKHHIELNKVNYGRNILQLYEEKRKKKQEEELAELLIIQQLEQRLEDILKNKNKVKTTEASILKLLISLKDNPLNLKVKANEILEASKLSPAFFNSLSLDYLSIYFKNEEVNELLISSCQNIILYNNDVISNYFLEKIISLIENEAKVNFFLDVLPFNLLKREQIISIASHLVNKYDVGSFYRHDDFQNHSPQIILFFKNLYSSNHEEFNSFFQEALKSLNSNYRANAVLILNHLFPEDNDIVLPLIKFLIKSLDLEDADYPKSADFIISKTLIKIGKLHTDNLMNIIKQEFDHLTVGGKVEIFGFYELFINNSSIKRKSTYTNDIVNELIKVCSEKNQPLLKEKAIDILRDLSHKQPKVLLSNFENFIGILSSSLITKSTFEWYKEDLDKNTLTFNPLKGKHVYEILHEQNIIDSEINKLKGILKKLLKYNQIIFYEKLIEIIRKINDSDKNSLQLKLILIEVIQDGVNDSVLLTNILPDLHTWLLDFENIPLRVHALRFLEKMLSNNFQIVPQTIFNLLEIFIDDDKDNLARKYAILCYKQLLANGKVLKESEINILLELYKNKYVIIHQTATEITYKLFDVLDDGDRNTLLFYLLNLLEVYHNEAERDEEFCIKLFRQTLYVSKESNPNHFNKTEKVLLERYFTEYCKNGDYYSRLSSLKELSSFRDRDSYYNDLWLQQSMSFINDTMPQRFEPFINSDRGKLYESILSLNLSNILPIKESIKENIKNRCIANVEIFSHDLYFTLIIFSYFNLSEDIIELTTFVKSKITKTQARSYFFNKIDEFERLASFPSITKVNSQEDFESDELITIQEEIATKHLSIFCNFKMKDINSILHQKDTLITEYEKLVTLSSETKEEDFFYSLKSFYSSILLLLEWSKDELEGNLNAISKLSASKANINLINLNSFNHIPSLKKQIDEIINLIKSITNFDSETIKDVIIKYSQVKIPFIYYLRENKTRIYTHGTREDEVEEEQEINIVSLELYLRDNPWANPQILKSKEIYNIKGIIKLNQIPLGFEILKIQPSTTNLDIFDLNIEEVILSQDKLQYEINGNIIFKYSQNSLDDLISIKLIPFFSNKKENLYPTIIGYDELITKVLDEKNDVFQTGFKMMNKKVFELYNDELIQQLDDAEKNDFFNILNGIINYQGYCLQSGKYKGVTKCKENDFRDDLIQHLSANVKIGEDIYKESHIAGGRVEIIYKGIVTELKVETKLSERNEIIQKYSNQPLAYSSGNSKLCSIACILDLTEKKSPPSPAINNIILNTTKTHGFKEHNSEYNPFQVFIFIDGNTKNPSDYSK